MSQDVSSNQTFLEKLLTVIWPIHRHELKKFLPMGFMMLCILFNYTILRDMKDTLIVDAVGASTISFIKFWVVTPASILFVVLYSKFSNKFSRESMFYITITPFLVFFAAFGFFLYPNQDLFQASPETINGLIEMAPHLQWFFMMYGSWIGVVFYTLSELWGSVVIALLFWQFANAITSVKEAKRFYAMFGLIGNFGLLLSGGLIMWTADQARSMVGGETEAFRQNLSVLMGAVCVAGLLIIGLYRWLNVQLAANPELLTPDEQKTAKAKKPKLGLKESFMLIIRSPYLGLVAMLVLGYGISINLVEVTYKSQIKLMYPNLIDYNAFMGKFSFITGLTTILLMIVGSNIIRIFGWLTAALATPVMILLTGVIFFSCIVFRDGITFSDGMSETLALVMMAPLTLVQAMPGVVLAVLMGMVQNILSKATKYSLYDSTLQMSYIPLDEELKVKGKAAVDVIGGRAGKAGGSLIQQVLLGIFAVGVDKAHQQEAIAPYLFGILFVIILLWLISVFALNRRFTALQKEKGLN